MNTIKEKFTKGVNGIRLSSNNLTQTINYVTFFENGKQVNEEVFKNIKTATSYYEQKVKEIK